ncbi:MAG: RNA polymerase sigma factor RpoS [Phycisphaerae bacterium]|nr:RNA polymerase sigma factor RpoS [Phycisphaerae bacterium]
MVRDVLTSNPALTRAELPQPPRFIPHAELRRAGAVHKLFRRSIDPPREGRLTHPEELVLFKRMQYCGYRMSRMWDDLERLSTPERKRYLRWYKQYFEIRDRLINANMGLVFDLLSKNRFTNVEYDEIRSEGLMALLRAVDTYDPWSGFRFSTYACNAILRAFSRSALMESKRYHLRAASYEPHMEPDQSDDLRHDEQLDYLAERVTSALKDDLAELNDTERFVLQERFPLHEQAKRATLKMVGEKMHISKERVRQIQESALNKLRRVLIDDEAELL